MKFSFSNIIVEPETHSIYIADKQKRLEPKLIALLTYLAQHSQQVITRQQITEAVWPNVVVVEESVTQAIFALRNALNDDAKRPRYIETIPKKGYRFLADVVFSAEPKQAAKKPLKRNIIIVSMILGIAVLISAVFGMRKPESQPRYEISNIFPTTTMAGSECCMSINSNQKMVFINAVDDSKDLYVKDLLTGSQERVTHDQWKKGIPLWLDDNTLIYPRCANGECQVVRQHLRESPHPLYTTANFIGEIAYTATNPNFLIINEEHENSDFIAFDLRSGQHELLRKQYANLPAHALHPVLSEDGKQLYFVSITPKPVLMSLTLSDQKIHTISREFDDINSFSLDQNQQFIIAGALNGTTGLWLLAQAGSSPSLIIRATGEERFQFPLVDSTKKSLYYESVEFNQNIGMSSNDNEAAYDFSELNSTSIDNLAVLSNDEKFLYFASKRTGFFEIWRYDFAARQANPVTHLRLPAIHCMSVSNDGLRLSVAYTNNMQAYLGVFSVHNGELLASTASHAKPLSWSRNDNSIYAKEDIDGIPTLMRYDSFNLQSHKIQKNVGSVAQDSSDGNALIFLDLERNSLIQRNLTSHTDKLLMNLNAVPEEARTGLLRIAADNSSAFVITKNKDRHQLWRYPFNTNSAPEKLMDFSKDLFITFINASGTKVLYDKEASSTGNIMRIELRQ